MRKVLLVVLLVLLLAGGGVVVMNYENTRAGIRQALRDAAGRWGLDPDWLESLGEVETGLQPKVNLRGTDAARGGSYGPTQISRQTARAFGYTDEMERLVADPRLAAELTAAMVARGFAERGGSLLGDVYVPSTTRQSVFQFGPPATYQDMCGVWNAGRPYAQLPAGGSTMEDYIPQFERYLVQVQQGSLGVS